MRQRFSDMCTVCKFSYGLLLFGGIIWGLEGISYFTSSSLNIVYLVFGSSILAGLMYLAIGVAAVVEIFGWGCECKRHA